MSQITRCPACRTSFRVVTDQLRISGGWVRCGRCKEVFDASAHMVSDARYLAMPQVPPTPPAPAPAPKPEPAVVTAAPAQTPVAAPVAEPPAASTPSVPVEQRPQVWGNARASVTGFSSASIQHLAQENVGAEDEAHKPGDATGAPSPVSIPVPQSAAPVQPWAGNFVPVPNTRLPEGLTQNISYGLRREANVVPPGWKPDTEAKTSVSAAPVVAPSPAPAPASEPERIEPEFAPSSSFNDSQERAPDAAKAAEPQTTAEAKADVPKVAAKAPVQAPEASLQEEPDEDMPELTFATSRQYALSDEEAEAAGVPINDRNDHPEAADEDLRVEPRLEEPGEEAPDSRGQGESVDTGRKQARSEPKGDAHAEVAESDVEAEPAPEPESESAKAEPLADHHDAEDEVGFMRAARRKAFWSKPSVRVLMAVLALALLALYAGQYAVAERNRLAAVYPGLRPALEQLCKPLDCVVGLPRQINAIAIDSSTFTRVKDDDSSFQLQVALKSAADMALEMPLLELTLTDTNDQVVLRRVLTNADTGAPAAIAANGDWNGVVKLHVPEVAERVTGFRVIAFYP